MNVSAACSLLLKHQRGEYVSEDQLRDACTALEVDKSQLDFCLEAARKCEGRRPARELSTPMGGQPRYRR